MIRYTLYYNNNNRKGWVVQSVKRQTLDFVSGQDLTVPEIEPRVGLCPDSVEPAWDSLSLSLSLSLPLSCLSTLSLSK